jgi:hypothetical protein
MASRAVSLISESLIRDRRLHGFTNFSAHARVSELKELLGMALIEKPSLFGVALQGRRYSLGQRAAGWKKEHIESFVISASKELLP